MLNNCSLNEYLRNCRNKGCFNSSQPQFLTPCEILNKYVNYPCSIFSENIVPIGPITPLPPPVPPVPPGRVVIGTGRFNVIPPGVPITFSPQINFIGATQGTGITHVNNSPFIELIPNTIYEYSYSLIITPTNIIIPNSVESKMILLLGVNNNLVPGSTITVNNINGTVTLTNSGSLTTDATPNPEIFLSIDNLNTGLQFTLDSGTLLIEAVR